MTDTAVDEDAEAGLLGAVIRSPRIMERLYGVAEPEWFAGHYNQAIWVTLEALWSAGEGLGLHGSVESWDHYTVRDRVVATSEMQPADFDRHTAVLSAAASSSISGLSETLSRLAYRRRMGQVGNELAEAARNATAGLDELTETASAHVERLAVTPRVSAGLWADDFLALADKDDPWVIPGLLRQGWRAMLVAGEGAGKSLALRQVAVCAASGIHPFALDAMPPINVLLVDLENPASMIRTSIRSLAGSTGTRDGLGRLRLVPLPAGLDVRQPRDRAILEAELRLTKPDLVCLGPLYKAYQRGARENDEQAATGAQQVLDDLRTRFGFALLMEHHAPHKDGYHREMRPIGSSAWLRWPELGLGLEPDPDRKGSVKITRWRGDRMSNAWPDRLDRDGRFPWVGYWANGRDQEPAA